MSTIKADGVEAATGTNTDLTLAGKGTGVPDLAAGFKVGSVAGVPTASIRDDAVTLAKLAAGTDGELITWDASGDPAAVAVGTATHILTSNGAGAAPTFQAAAAGGAWTLLSTANLSAAAGTDLTGMSTTYEVYLLTWTAIQSHTSTQVFYVQFADGSSTRTSLYSQRTDTSGLATNSFTNSADNSFPRIDLGRGAVFDGVRSNSGYAFLQFPTDGATYPKLTGQYISDQSTTSCMSGSILGRWHGAINPTKLVITGGSTNITGRFSLYGLALS